MERKQFTVTLLNEIIERDQAILVGSYEHTSSESRIAFRCCCGTEHMRKFSQIERSSGAFCKICVEHRRQQKIKETNLTRYGVERPSQAEVFKQKAIETNMERYGHPSSNQADSVKAKKVESCRERLGVDNPGQSETVKARARQTNLEVYGCENPFGNEDIKAKIKTQMIARHGVENPSQSAEFQSKKVETMTVKFGVPYAMQNPDVFERSQNHSHRAKDFVMPSGSIRRVRGFEPFALRDLLQTYSEDQIKTGKGVPFIQYEGPDGKERRYFPDIYIEHENKIIEVKSDYTYTRDLATNLLKKKFTEDRGYTFEFWVYVKGGHRIPTPS
jgi:hypothetical protein